jgi:hypothetical protein
MVRELPVTSGSSGPGTMNHERFLCFQVSGLTSFQKIVSMERRSPSPKELDQSGLGIELMFLTAEQSVNEAENA